MPPDARQRLIDAVFAWGAAAPGMAALEAFEAIETAIDEMIDERSHSRPWAGGMMACHP